MSDLPSVSLPQYEGPLDLLLDLVRQHRLNILDLPIAEVTRQYLDYIHQAQQLNIDLGAEFIFMEATLILIKSRSLLPRRPSEPDPRDDLAEQLMSHEQAKQAGELLAERLEEAAKTWSVPGVVEEPAEAGADSCRPLIQPGVQSGARAGNINLLDALQMMHKALALARTRRPFASRPDPVTLDQMIRWLASQIRQVDGKQMVILEELLRKQATPEHRAVVFLGVLEMARRQQIRLDQDECFGAVHVSAATENQVDCCE